MQELPCLCGNRGKHRVVFDQNFTEDEISPNNFSARGRHDFEVAHLHYRIVRCGACGQLFSSPILEAGKIEALYRESPQDYMHEKENIVRSYINPLKKWAGFVANKDTAVEIGCGTGFFLEALKKTGFKNLIGVEPSTDAVSKASETMRSVIRNCPFEDTAFEENFADLICAFQVLDHFVDPVTVMERFFRMLKPYGLCYVIIHNEEALHVKLFGDNSPIIDVSHVYYFNPKTLKRLFENNGFEVLDLFNIWNRYTMRTWLRMLPIPFKRTIESVMRLLKLDNMTVRLPAGNIGIIGKKIPAKSQHHMRKKRYV